MSSVSADDKICLSFQGGDIACNRRCSPDAHGFPCWTVTLRKSSMCVGHWPQEEEECSQSSRKLGTNKLSGFRTSKLVVAVTTEHKVTVRQYQFVCKGPRQSLSWFGSGQSTYIFFSFNSYNHIFSPKATSLKRSLCIHIPDQKLFSPCVSPHNYTVYVMQFSAELYNYKLVTIKFVKVISTAPNAIMFIFSVCNYLSIQSYENKVTLNKGFRIIVPHLFIAYC